MHTKTLVRAAIVLAAVLAFTGPAIAVPVKVAIPKEGWSITFDSPSLSKREESKGDGEYAFRANSGRFNLSLFVEKPGGAGKTHRDCYEFYWSQARRNPMIAQDSVQSSETPSYVRVQYDIVTQFQGQPIRQRHVHYYFVYRGKWVDVHISVIVPTKEDEEIFAAFDRSLRYSSG
jgi:hypothetical protein